MAKTKAAKPEPTKEKPGLMPRLNLPVTADRSRIAYDSLQEKTREQLRVVLADPELRAKLELPELAAAAGDAAPALPETWDATFGGFLWDAIGKLCVTVAVRQGYTPADAAVLEFSENEKAQLAGPTAAVLDKYFPGGLSRYGPEVVLGVSLLVIMQGKIAALQQAAAAHPAAAPAAGGGTLHPFPAGTFGAVAPAPAAS